MWTSKFSEEQIVTALRQAEAGMNPTKTPARIDNLRERIDRTVAESRFTMRIMIALAVHNPASVRVCGSAASSSGSQLCQSIR